MIRVRDKSRRRRGRPAERRTVFDFLRSDVVDLVRQNGFLSFGEAPVRDEDLAHELREELVDRLQGSCAG